MRYILKDIGEYW